MPFDRSKYPPDWTAISRRVREDAGWRCEWCGIAQGSTATKSGGRVVLTVAHVDHDTANNSPANLAALCQACHLRHDLPLHQRNAAETRRRRRVERGQLALFGPNGGLP